VKPFFTAEVISYLILSFKLKQTSKKDLNITILQTLKRYSNNSNKFVQLPIKWKPLNFIIKMKHIFDYLTLWKTYFYSAAIIGMFVSFNNIKSDHIKRRKCSVNKQRKPVHSWRNNWFTWLLFRLTKFLALNLKFRLK